MYNTTVNINGDSVDLPKPDYKFSLNWEVFNLLASQVFPDLHQAEAVERLIELHEAMKVGMDIVPNEWVVVDEKGKIDYNVYSENDAAFTTGIIPTRKWNYSGLYAAFTLSKECHADNGTKSLVAEGDELYMYADNVWLNVLKVDKSTPFAHIVYAAPIDKSDKIVTIIAKQPMLVIHRGIAP